VRYIIDLPYMHERNFSEVFEHTTLGLINFITKKKNSIFDARDLGVDRKSFDETTLKKRLKEEIARKMHE
jgi:Tfp pilus assembly ATPase PilU